MCGRIDRRQPRNRQKMARRRRRACRTCEGTTIHCGLLKLSVSAAAAAAAGGSSTLTHDVNAFVHPSSKRQLSRSRFSSRLNLAVYSGSRRKRRRPGIDLYLRSTRNNSPELDYQEEDGMEDDIIDAFPYNAIELTDPSDDSTLSTPSLDNVLGNLNLTVASSSAEQPDIAYFYLKDKIGLSDETMWKITFEAGSVLGLTAKTLDWKISVLRRNMKLSDDDIREIIRKYPAILHKSADKKLAPTILLLVRALDLSKADLRAMIVKYPCIMGYSAQNLLSKVDFFTGTMGFTIDETRKLVVDDPRLMCAAVETGLMPRMGFLHKEMAISMEDLRKIVKKNPRVLLYSVEKNLKEKLISFLVMRLRMESRHVCKLLLAFPELLDYNLEDVILPIARYFMSDLEFSPTEFRSIMLKYPRLMSNSLRKIKHVVGFFRYEFDLDASQVKRIIFQGPQTVALSDDNLKSKISFLRDMFKLDTSEVRKVIVGMPTLLMCSIESNLRPKAEYLLQAFDNDATELKMAILKQPTLLGYSQKKRIEPRMESLIDIGAHPRSIVVGIPMTDANFRVWLERKAMEIVENGGKEPVRGQKRTPRTSRSAALVLGKDETQISEEKEASAIDKASPDRSSRIVHWKR